MAARGPEFFACAVWPCCTVLVHVVVVGCGRVGSGLAMVLAAEGHSVAVIDRSQRAFRRLPAEVECKRVVGPGSTATTSNEPGRSAPTRWLP
jgi:trk system potassium uptake protein